MGAQVVGRITRGTTGVNRLRRLDRWLMWQAPTVLPQQHHPIVVDLGFGATAHTAIELASRLHPLRPSAHFYALDINPERVTQAQQDIAAGLGADHLAGVSFTVACGGFELGGPLAGQKVHLIRAANVLRQYHADEVLDLWALLQSRLAPGGLIQDATCDELGRRCAWVALDDSGPQSLSISLKLRDLEDPKIVAERLPKILIHRNVPGKPIYDYLSDLSRSWQLTANLSTFGARQRWLATCTHMAEHWPIATQHRRWRLGELTVPWSAIAPSPPAR